MSLFTRPTERSLSGVDLWGDAWGTGRGSASNVTSVGPVYAAVALLADLFSSTPARVVQDIPDGQADTVAMPDIIRDPDPYIAEMTWRYQLTTSLKLRGNAWGIVDPERRYLRWLHPDWVMVDETNRFHPRFYVLGKEQTLAKHGGVLVHVPEFVQPGSVLGLSPIQAFASTFDMAALAGEYGRKWFKNASVPPAILKAKSPNVKGPQLREAVEDIMQATKGGRPVALPGDWDYQKIALTADEAQFLATIKATATTIAAIFRVNPEDIGGESGTSRTYSNREMDQELLNVRTLQPIGVRLSQALAGVLPRGQRVVYDLDFLAQPGQLDSAKWDTEELKNGSITLPEVRRRRGRPALTPAEIADWQKHYATQRSESASEATSTSIAKEA